MLACLMACSSERATTTGSPVKRVQDRKLAPDFTLKDMDGRAVHLSDYRGKVVLLNFWATWCGPCKIEIPWFMELEQRLKGQGFAVLGIAMDEEGWQAVKPFLAELKVNYRTLLGNESVTQLYGGVDSLPTSFIIDREGRIASIHVGLVSKSRYENEIQALLGQKAGLNGSSRDGVVAATVRRN